MIKQVEVRVGGNARQRITELLDKGLLAAGRTNIEFEEKFADFCGVGGAVSCCNGTQALHVVWRTLGIKSGEPVLTTPFTFIASSNSILYADAVPVFADICPDTFNIDPNRVEDALKKNRSIKTLLLVNLYGLICDIDAFRDLQERYGLTIVEDCAQAHGAEFDGRRAGSFFDAATFSFYATKNICSGEGGMCLFKRPEHLDLARKFINHGRCAGYEHDELGYNYRMTEIQAAIGISSLEENEELTAKRIANAEFYCANLPEEVIPPKTPPGYKHVFHQYVVRAPRRDELRVFLEQKGVQTAIVYPIPNYRQPIYRKLFPSIDGLSLPITEQACSEVLSLPIHPYLSRQDLEHVCSAVREFYRGSE